MTLGVGGWIADLLGYKDIYDSLNNLLPRRKALRFVGAGLVDNALLGTTDVFGGSTALQNQFFVNPSAVATGTVFNTIQAAINAVTPGVFTQIFLPPGGRFTENLVFATSSFIEIITPIQTGYGVSLITGNITDAGGTAQFAVGFTNTYVTGNITLSATAAFSFLSLRNSTVTGNISCPGMTLWAFGNQPPQSLSTPPGQSYSFIVQTNLGLNGTVNAGHLVAYNGVSLPSNITCANGLICDSHISCSAITGNVDILRSSVRNALAISGNCRCDAFSMGNLIQAGVTAGGLYLLEASITVPLTAFSNNIAATAIQAALPPVGMYQVYGALQCISGAGTGTASLNVSGTDEAGAFTIPICTLNTASGVGRSSGALPIRSTGVSNLTYSITGISAPGSFVGKYEIKLKKL